MLDVGDFPLSFGMLVHWIVSEERSNEWLSLLKKEKASMFLWATKPTQNGKVKIKILKNKIDSVINEWL